MPQAIDWFIIVFVFFSAILGFFRGVTKELFGLASWGAAIGITYVLFPFASKIARSYIASDALADGVALLAAFIVLLALFSFLSHLMSALIQKSILGSIDRSLGFGFGIVRGCLILFIMDIALSCVCKRAEYPDFIRNGHFCHFVQQGGDTFLQMLPSSVTTYVEEKRKTQQAPMPFTKEGRDQQKTNSSLKDNLGKYDAQKQENNKHCMVDDVTQHLKQHIAHESRKFLEKKVEELATLKPKRKEAIAPKKSKAATSSSQSDLERMLDQIED